MDEISLPLVSFCEEVKVHPVNDGSVYKCGVCFEQFLSESVAKEHAKIHETTPPSAATEDANRYACNVCCKYLLTVSLLSEHTRLHVAEKPSNDAKICTAGKPFECKKCGKLFSVKQNYQRHLMLHGRRGSKLRKSVAVFEETYKKCDGQFSFGDNEQSDEDLSENEHSDEEFSEDDDQQRLHFDDENTRNVTEDGEPVAIAEVKFECYVCLKLFSTALDLKEHMRSHDPVLADAEPVNKHACEVCGKRFPKVEGLQRHMAVHAKGKKMECKICHKKFAQTSNLKSHVLVIHNPDGLPLKRKPLTHFCEFCDKGFSAPCFLERHVRTHTGEKPFKCPLCDRRFAQTMQVTSHMSFMHSDNKKEITNNVCFIPGCNKNFATKNALNRHKNKHFEHPNFTCEECGKVYFSRMGLKKHMVIHGGDVVGHKCEVCDKIFDSRTSLTDHRNIHTGVFTYECQVCRRNLQTRKAFRQHSAGKCGRRAFKHRCDYAGCGKCFFSEEMLRKHMMAHEVQPSTSAKAGAPRSKIGVKVAAACGAPGPIDHVDSETNVTNQSEMDAIESGAKPSEFEPPEVETTCMCDANEDMISENRSSEIRTLPTEIETNSAEMGIQTVNLQSGKFLYKCQVCRKNFRTKNSLWHHSVRKCGKKFRCDYAGCEKYFLCEALLTRHRKVHESRPCTSSGFTKAGAPHTKIGIQAAATGGAPAIKIETNPSEIGTLAIGENKSAFVETWCDDNQVVENLASDIKIPEALASKTSEARTQIAEKETPHTEIAFVPNKLGTPENANISIASHTSTPTLPIKIQTVNKIGGLDNNLPISSAGKSIPIVIQGRPAGAVIRLSTPYFGKPTKFLNNSRREFRCKTCQTSFPNSTGLSAHRCLHSAVSAEIRTVTNQVVTLDNNMPISSARTPIVVKGTPAVIRLSTPYFGPRLRPHHQCSQSVQNSEHDLPRPNAAEKSFSCRKKCGYSFSSHTKLVEHIVNSHAMAYVCQECGERFKQSRDLSLHWQDKHN